jgi:hypothetical protein
MTLRRTALATTLVASIIPALPSSSYGNPYDVDGHYRTGYPGYAYTYGNGYPYYTPRYYRYGYGRPSRHWARPHYRARYAYGR